MINLDADVVLNVLHYLPQSDISNVARASRWLRAVAQPVLYHQCLSRGIHRARSLALALTSQEPQSSAAHRILKVQSLELRALGVAEVTTARHWEELQTLLIRAVRSPACAPLERFKIEVLLPGGIGGADLGWGESIWEALRENCPKLASVEVQHNAFTGTTQLACIPNLRRLSLSANMSGGSFDFSASHLLSPLEALSPGLEHLDLDMRKDFVYPIQVETMFQRTWPCLRVLNLSWGYYESTMSDLCAFLERHTRLEHLTIRGITPPRITHIADDALLALRSFDGDMDVAQSILASPQRSVQSLATWVWDLDMIIASLEALPKSAVAALRSLDIKFVAHMEVASGVTGAALRAFAAAAPNVEELTLRGVLTGEWGWPAYRDAFSDFRKLRRLAMATPSLVGGIPLARAIDELARRLPMLEFVDLAVGQDDALTTMVNYGHIRVRRRADN
ncbi:hypothetical protein EXIGLDRAFT_471617 [Exidia glandulosa HHB12029]|uniref:F-box domain-containing protein n=1 Tax=Exidia glandulosa HHB12029 TaxID=1314781 RepID=A0A165AU20_EXIGL|nr:hypothetical protein EXIGLDRAFT_471617 [Exidia glandulosa HHB12029]